MDKFIGVNIGAISDWSSNIVFADAMLSARKFGSPDSPWDESAPLDQEGWPTGDFGVMVMSGLAGIGGTYKLSFNGSAQVLPVASDAVVIDISYDETRDLSTASVKLSDSATQLCLKFVNQHGVKNIKLIRPGIEDNVTFNPSLIKVLEPFSAIRFMDPLRINGNPVVRWEDRTQKDRPQATEKGMAYEYAIELCNTTKKHLWLNIPLDANDDHIRNLAKLVKNTLDNNLDVYVEWSNEVWNWVFPQGHVNLEEAQQEKNAGLVNYNYDNNNNIYYWAWFRVGYNAVRVSKIFAEVFGKEQINKRVKVLLAQQIAWSDQFVQTLKFIKNVLGEPSDYIYAISGAPYTNIGDLTYKEGVTSDEILSALIADSNNAVKSAAQIMADLAKQYNVKFICYEGGIDLFQSSNGTEQKTKAQLDPGMKDVVLNYLDKLFSNCDGLMYYNLCSEWGQYGYWGLVRDLNFTTPKLEAIKEYTAKKAGSPRDMIKVSPCRLLAEDAAYMTGSAKLQDMPDGGKNIGFIGPSNQIGFVFVNSQAGNFDLVFRTAVPMDATFSLTVQGTKIGKIQVTKTDSWNNYADTVVSKVGLPKGPVFILIDSEESGLFNINYIDIRKV